jgi:transcriptional regulator with XRE-family HTH domain
MATDVVNFGKFLRRIRKERNLKLKHIAAALNKSPAYVCDLEKGRRGHYINPLLLVKLADVLNVPITTMFNQANIEVDENSLKYRAYLKMTRNKQRSARILKAFETSYSLIETLKSEAKDNPPLANLANSLMVSLRELDTAISLA